MIKGIDVMESEAAKYKFERDKKSTPWDLTFSPRSLREPAK